MKIAMVAAMAKGRALGKNNRLPWPTMRSDMKRFHDSVTNKVAIMGKNTYESLPAALPSRLLVVLAEEGYEPNAERVRVVHSIEEALKVAEEDLRAHGEEDGEVMVSGGANVYAQFLPRADRMYLTYIDGTFDADAYFPEWDKDEWGEVEHEEFEADDKNPYPYTFVTLQRRT
jgi:dihydrofolate reductase